MRPLAQIGRVSYSLYLWHWPVYVIYGAILQRPLTSSVEDISILTIANDHPDVDLIRYDRDSFSHPKDYDKRREVRYRFGCYCCLFHHFRSFVSIASGLSQQVRRSCVQDS